MADESLKFHFLVDGDDFTVAGEASSNIKKALKKIGISPDIVRRVAIAMYEGEINMVIHANGGYIDVLVDMDKIVMTLCDSGPGIADVEKAMQEGFSTATDKVRELGFGAGMGLPNMKKCTDTIEIETKIGVGTTVKMTILM